jgi:hypothetical protein
MIILEKLHWAPGIYPVADFMAGTVNTDIIECKSAVGVLFQITKGIGLTGTSTITIQACDTIVPGNTTAVAFMYRSTAAGGTDVWSDWAQATATGFVTTAGSNQMYQCFVPAAELASEGYGYVRLNAVEVVASAVTGCINMAVVQGRVQPEVESLLD